MSIILALPIGAKVLISPIDAMQQTYGLTSKVSEDSLILTDTQVQQIQNSINIKLESKIYKILKAQINDKIVGYAILINKTIRSKNGVVLYVITPEGVIKNIEIIAFNEPIEYMPNKKWIEQFNNTTIINANEIAKKTPAITGATLSANTIKDGSKIALAIYDTVIKGK